MVTRTYGVKNAAGVSVTEEEVRGPIQPGRFGTGGVVGVFERGNPMEPIVMVGPKQMKRNVGGRLTGTVAPDAVEDFWDNSDGAGTLVAVRITDGNERQAGLRIMSRHTGVGHHVSGPEKTDAEGEIIPVLDILAKNGGRWAGRAERKSVTGLTIAGNITETTVATGLTLLENELAGGYLVLDGVHPDAAKQYEIISNTTAGVITVRPGYTMLTDVSAAVQFVVGVMIHLPEVSLGTNKSKGLAVLFTEGALNPGLEFGLKVYTDGVKVHEWDSLSMNPLSPRYVETVVNDDDANEEIEVTDLLQTGVPITQFNRPGNFTRQVDEITSSKVTFKNVVVKQNDDPASINPVSYSQASQALTPGILTFTWSTADTRYNVTFAAGIKPGMQFEELSPFHAGGGAAPNIDWASPVDYLPSITFDAIANPADGTVVAVEILPVDPEMVGGVVYPDVDTAQLTGFAIRTTDHNSVTVESGDPSSVGSAGTQGEVIGTIAESSSIDVVIGTSDAMLISVDGRMDLPVTLTAGVGRTIQDLVNDIDTAITATFGAGAFTLGFVEADGGELYLRLTSPGGFDGAGPGSSVTLKATTAVHDATYVLLGFTVPASPTGEVTYRGTSGTRARIEYLQSLTAGYDGLAPDVTKYLAAFALDASPFSTLRESGYGNFMLNAPGIILSTSGLSDADVIAIHKQGIRYAESMPYQYFGETPLDLVDEVDALNYWNTQVGRSDMLCTYLPSMVDIIDPDAPKKLKRISAMSGVMGHWAKKAVENQGYHRPAAGPDAELYKVVKLPDGWDNLNEEFLNPGGFNVIKKRRGSFLVWGARTLYENSLWTQATVRMQMNHYVWVFLDNYDWVIFALNDEETWALIEAATVEYLDGQVGGRVLSAPAGGKAYTVKIDADNNPQSEIDAGVAHLDVKLNFTKFIEQLKISVGAGGISEAA